MRKKQKLAHQREMIIAIVLTAAITFLGTWFLFYQKLKPARGECQKQDEFMFTIDGDDFGAQFITPCWLDISEEQRDSIKTTIDETFSY
ncbi:MAG: hypothetical protein O3B64_03745 [bacterium]|nr:hypothetical protein [bacterium]